MYQKGGCGLGLFLGMGRMCLLKRKFLVVQRCEKDEFVQSKILVMDDGA